MITILGLMKKIRENPHSYLGEVSVYRLRSFLEGYVTACAERGLAGQTEDLDYNKFDEWFRHKFGVTERSFISCKDLIHLLSVNDADAFENFLKLVDEFCAEHGASALNKGAHGGMPQQSLSELLKEIKERPAMHLGIASLSLLAEFLRGYQYARKECELPPSPGERDLEGFQSWLPSRLNVNAKCSWDRVILAFCRDERDALKLFFDLYHEFVAGKKEPLSEP
jgi:hypothetical protein